MNSTPEIIEDIVVALLAVSAYPMERVAKILPSLRESKLTEPAFVAAADEGEITKRLNGSGYQRGLLVGMYAERLQAVMQHICSGGIDGIEPLIATRDREAIGAIFRGVRGVGPKVLDNLFILLFSDG